MDRDRWERAAREPSPWIDRLRLIAGLIRPGETVVDVGAGSQELRGLLPIGCSYQAIDCVPVHGAIVVDLDDQVLPPVVPGTVDVAVFAGVLEYLQRPLRALLWSSLLARRVIFSYDHGPLRDRRWEAPCSSADFEALGARPVGEWRGQTIYQAVTR